MPYRNRSRISSCCSKEVYNPDFLKLTKGHTVGFEDKSCPQPSGGRLHEAIRQEHYIVRLPIDPPSASRFVYISPDLGNPAACRTKWPSKPVLIIGVSKYWSISDSTMLHCVGRKAFLGRQLSSRPDKNCHIAVIVPILRYSTNGRLSLSCGQTFRSHSHPIPNVQWPFSTDTLLFLFSFWEIHFYV